MTIKEAYNDFVKSVNVRESQDGYVLSNGVLICYKEHNNFVDLIKYNKDGNKVCYTIFDAVKDAVEDSGFYLNFQDNNGEMCKGKSIEELVKKFNDKC